MIEKRLCIGLLAVLVLCAPALRAAEKDAAGEYKRLPGPFAVEIARFDWKDVKRDRLVPAKIYYPKEGVGPFPLVIVSHGLGGSREGYEYLGRHWASHGYVSVHLQHLGSDSGVWQNQAQRAQQMRQAAANPINAINRAQDVSFAIEQMEAMNREAGPLQGRLDLGRIGVAGHSFGAHTALAVAGQVHVLPGGREVAFAEARVRAVIPMSAPPAQKREQFDKAYGAIKLPCLHMTGTRDYSPINNTRPEERRIPFDHIRKAEQYLIIFKDGDHMVFAGSPRLTPSARKSDVRFHDLIRMSSTAFWDAYLKEDVKAKGWLREGGFEAVLGAEGTFEKK